MPNTDDAAPDATISACYVETNSSDFSNLGKYTLENGKALFDIGIIFAANINGTPESPELHLNDTVTATLSSGVVPQLQAKGIKVLLSILGNHQTAGITTLVGSAPQDFARQLSEVVSKYNLDGIDFDDEWSQGTPNPSSFVSLVSALRKLMPEKIISFYFYGPAAQYLSYDGIQIGDLINYSWNPMYSMFNSPDVPGLSNSHRAPAAINMNPVSGTYTPPDMAAQFARNTLAGGYGAYLYYDLINSDLSGYLSSVSQVLYNQKTIYQG